MADWGIESCSFDQWHIRCDRRGFTRRDIDDFHLHYGNPHQNKSAQDDLIERVTKAIHSMASLEELLIVCDVDYMVLREKRQTIPHKESGSMTFFDAYPPSLRATNLTPFDLPNMNEYKIYPARLDFPNTRIVYGWRMNPDLPPVCGKTSRGEIFYDTTSGAYLEGEGGFRYVTKNVNAGLIRFVERIPPRFLENIPVDGS